MLTRPFVLPVQGPQALVLVQDVGRQVQVQVQVQVQRVARG